MCHIKVFIEAIESDKSNGKIDDLNDRKMDCCYRVRVKGM
jgi:hypothetical protein